MTRIGVIADVHIGNHRRFGGEFVCGVNRRCQMALDTLGAAIMKADECEVNELFIAGDLFDGVNVEPQVIAQTQRVLAQGDVLVHLVLGNHEQMSMAPGDNSLSPLRPVVHSLYDSVGVRRAAELDIACVPFSPGPACEWIADGLAALGPRSGESRILVTHVGLIDEDTPAYLRTCNDAIETKTLAALCRKAGIYTVFAGNWHRMAAYEQGDVDMYQVGALVPTGFDNEGISGYGTLLIYDSKTKKVSQTTIPGPRFCTVNFADAAEVAKWDLHKNPFFFRLDAQPSEYGSAEDFALELTEAGALAVDVSVDDGSLKEAAQDAAAAARGSETLGEAVAEFVSRMPLDEGVERDKVLAKVRSYLGL